MAVLRIGKGNNQNTKWGLTFPTQRFLFELMCYYVPYSAGRNSALLHESSMTTHAKGFDATSPMEPITSRFHVSHHMLQ